jgi:gamma-glutamyltranspeptidase/glutathione hydrolase
VAVLQMLNILETFDVKALGQGSADSTHLLAETMKLAYADRTRYVGDPDFVRLPMKGMLSKTYAADRAKLISMDRSLETPDIAPGDPWRYEGAQTTHFSVADPAGNIVTNTYTLGSSYGSGAVIDGAGFILNDQMKNFALRAGTGEEGLSGSPANALAPGKRMMSTMAPTIVFKDDKPWLITGTPGGSTILNTILQVIVNVVDYDLNVAEATHAPRIHQQWRPNDLEVEPNFNPDTIRLLKAKGHDVDAEETRGSAQSILIENGRFYGAADPRRPGALAVAP